MNGVCGLSCLFSCARYLADPANNRGHLWMGLLYPALGFGFDVFDGKVARWSGSASMLGQEMDSLADLVSPRVRFLSFGDDKLGDAGARGGAGNEDEGRRLVAVAVGGGGTEGQGERRGDGRKLVGRSSGRLDGPSSSSLPAGRPLMSSRGVKATSISSLCCQLPRGASMTQGRARELNVHDRAGVELAALPARQAAPSDLARGAPDLSPACH